MHDRPIRKTHDLVAIGMQCVTIDASLEPLLRQVGRLTKYAWLYRYPGSPDPLPVEGVLEAVGLASSVFERISVVVANAGAGNESADDRAAHEG